MEKIFCTIITGNYLPWALALNDSIKGIDSNSHLVILCVDQIEPPELPFVTFFNLEDLEGVDLFSEILLKYKDDNNRLRWCLKSILMQKLLSRYKKVVYCDQDLFFYSKFDFLFDYLDENRAILTPHWRARLPQLNETEFTTGMWGGLYNAGFIGANVDAIEILQWWAAVCLYKCDVDRPYGFYDDQKYLDLMPIHFEGVHIVRHQGCNVAGWNIEECKRSVKNDQVFINEQYPVVFVHFSGWTVHLIEQGIDHQLQGYWRKVQTMLQNYGWQDVPTAPKKPDSISFLGRVINRLKKSLRKL